MNTVTPAELLLDMAQYVLHTPGILIAEGQPHNCAEVITLALRLRANPPIALRAQVEGWNKLQIVRELW